jgi:hypothetical protein
MFRSEDVEKLDGKKACLRCQHHFTDLKKVNLLGELLYEMDVSECRRNPPKSNKIGNAVFPRVGLGFWCGSFKQKECTNA